MTDAKIKTEEQAIKDNPIEAILSFWFGELDVMGLSEPEQHALWFKKSEDTDRLIQKRFGGLLERATAGELDNWTESDRGLMALIVLLDQFSRNIHRDNAHAFAADAKALTIAQQAIAADRHLRLPLIHRVFLCLPLEHCEDLAVQEQCINLFEALVALNSEAMVDYTQYAVAHRDVIAQFGRFPHRNRILGRESSEEELEYLLSNGGF